MPFEHQELLLLVVTLGNESERVANASRHLCLVPFVHSSSSYVQWNHPVVVSLNEPSPQMERQYPPFDNNVVPVVVTLELERFDEYAYLVQCYSSLPLF